MEPRKLEFGPYKTRAEFARLIVEARARYDELIESLGQLGTETYRNRILERDPDISPHNFIRNGVHRFIFPPQEVNVVNDPDAGELSGTRPYTLVLESQSSEFDESGVDGSLEVSYDDAGSAAKLRVKELEGSTELSQDVVTLIDRALEPLGRADN